jgi:hypothetical protein
MGYLRSRLFDLGLALTVAGAVLVVWAIRVNYEVASGLGAVAGGTSATALVGIPSLIAGMILLIIATIRTRLQQRNY